MSAFLYANAGPLVFFTVASLFALCCIPSLVVRMDRRRQPRVPAPRRPVSSNRKSGRVRS